MTNNNSHPSPDTDSNEFLNNLSTEELGRLFPIIIEAYSNKWPALYLEEAQSIKKAFSENEIVKIDHIGSTAIPGLKAKPTIDILLQVAEQISIEKLKERFQSLGYLINTRPENPPPHLTFVKGYTTQGFKGQAFHVHIRYPGNCDEISFKDYLIRHPKIAREYESLKLKLAKKYPNDREAYTASKTDWILRMNERIREQYGRGY